MVLQDRLENERRRMCVKIRRDITQHQTAIRIAAVIMRSGRCRGDLRTDLLPPYTSRLLMLRNAGVGHEIEGEYLARDRALIRLDVESSVETGERFVDPAKCRETLAEQAVGLSEAGIGRESLLAIGQCFGNVPGQEQDTGLPEPSIRVVGCQGDCAIAIRHGFVKSLQLL